MAESSDLYVLVDGELIPATSVKAIDIWENIQGEDVVKFEYENTVYESKVYQR
tara:strand:+ start:3430 stop:3588 length:159 start_codon:yes stop_codon:yes gene_type:complete